MTESLESLFQFLHQPLGRAHQSQISWPTTVFHATLFGETKLMLIQRPPDHPSTHRFLEVTYHLSQKFHPRFLSTRAAPQELTSSPCQATDAPNLRSLSRSKSKGMRHEGDFITLTSKIATTSLTQLGVVKTPLQFHVFQPGVFSPTAACI